MGQGTNSGGSGTTRWAEVLLPEERRPVVMGVTMAPAAARQLGAHVTEGDVRLLTLRRVLSDWRMSRLRKRIK